jgi:hypothetical protein
MYGVKTSDCFLKGTRGRVAWLLAFVVSLASCREHRQVCEGEGCAAVAVDDGGTGMAGSPTGLEGNAGAGGADTLPECSRDVQCDNGLVCDGAEQCTNGRCEAGQALKCAYDTRCVEQGAERCVYETSSPWLLAMTPERVMALRLAELAAGHVTMIPLVERESHQAFVGFGGAFFSPNGQFALVASGEEQFGSSYRLARFGAGLPRVGDILDLPNWGRYWDAPQFQADSSRVRIVDRHSGSYVVDLTRDPAVTKRQDVDDPAWRTGACNDGKSSLRVDDDYLVYVDTVEDGITTTRQLGEHHYDDREHYYEISPDGRFVLLTSDEFLAEVPEVMLTYCSGDPRTLEFDDAFDGELSPDLKLLWLSLNDGGQRVVSIEDLSAPVEVWASSAAEDVDGARFTPDSRRLLFEAAEGANEPSVHVVDLSSAELEAHDLGLVPGVELFYTGDAALLAIDASLEGRVRYFWQSLSSTEPPRLVLERTTSQASEFSRGFLEEGSFFVERSADEHVEIFTLRLAADGFELTSLATFEGVQTGAVEMAPDHSGVLVEASTNFIDNKLYWVALSPDGVAGEPLLLLERASSFGFQREAL